jgi:glycerol-3-phosphate dehydrogenase
MIQTDIAILGGGIAGLWLNHCFRLRGYHTLLFEKDALGAGQTLASQGMIHGGVKYKLNGLVTSASQTIAAMPEIWQHCLDGKTLVNDETIPDLRNVQCLADRYYLFSDASITGRLTALLGNSVTTGDTRKLKSGELPPPFSHQDFRGDVYELPDAVLNTSSLVTELAAPYRQNLIRSSPSVISNPGESISALRLEDGSTVTAQYYVFTAGAGNEPLLAESGIGIPMQKRPLHQVMLKGPDLPWLYAHAVSPRSGDKPRVTISAHPVTGSTDVVWYLGGHLAESGVNRGETEQITFAQSELRRIFPYMDFSSCQWATLRIDRAEPARKDHLRPDQPFSETSGNAIVCWPTKLTLVPLLMRQVFRQIETSPRKLSPDTSHLPLADVAQPPWQTAF